jgi:hypothetical protein
MLLTTALRCGLSGLVIGRLEVATTAGALPYLSHWDKMQVRHPVFSLAPIKLFQFTKKEWERLAKSVAEEEISDSESDILRVSYLACLHQFGKIKQDQPILPPFHVVQSTLLRVIHLAYWKYTLDSARFRFPEYHISEMNRNLELNNITDYLEDCFAVREAYSKKMDDLAEIARNKAAEAALQALSREWVTPVSKKVLWNWVKSQLGSNYEADTQGWLSTLFLGGSAAIVDFEEEDLELFEEIITSSCPNGTGIMKAVRERVAKVWELWKAHHRAFEIDLEDFAVNNGLLVNGVQVAYPDPGPEPQQREFGSNRGKYFQAHAKWSIAKAAWESQNRRSDDPSVNKDLGEI